jgi:NAD(P)-dependent dehydrogenase (short-subunit alcohol dehydrogenase family)
MDLGLAGRVGLSTGAGGEIEAATARLLREEGAELDPDRSEAADFLVNFIGDAAAGDRRTRFELAVIEPMRAMKSVAPLLVERGEGRIVNVVATADPVTGAAALALSRLFADRYAKRGVLVNAVAPAPGADPETVAREIAFLCSERASHIAGTAEVIG